MTKQSVVALFIAVALGSSAVVLASRYERPEPAPPQPHTGMTVGSDSIALAPDAPQWSAIVVEPAAAPSARWSDPVPARIAFDETRTSRIGSPLAGRVVRVAVERGQRVKSGDALFTVASSGLAELRSDREKALVERAAARTGLDRTQALVDAQALPGKELVGAKQTLDEAELAVQLADQKLSTLKVSAGADSSFTVTAPRDGVVVELAVANGQQVDSSGALAAIADLSEVWVVADVFESNTDGLATGARAKVILADAEVPGLVDRVSEVVDPDRHTVPVRVKLANATGALRPNAHAQLELLDTSPAVADLPASAVMSDGTASFVFVREGGELKRRSITVGATHQGRTTIRAGLAPGEGVVVHGTTLLDNQIALDH